MAPEFGVKPEGLSDTTLSNRLFAAILKDVITTLEQQTKDLTTEQEDKILESIREGLKRLTPEEQRKIITELKLDRLTAETLLQVFRSGGLLVSGLVAANAAGFGLYLAATTVTHAVFTTLLGITLSFGTYTALTTTIAFLLNPLTGVLLVTGLGGFLDKRRSSTAGYVEWPYSR